jgi:hypothetical protein
MRTRLAAGVALSLIALPAAAQGGWQRNPAGYSETWIQRVEERSRLLIQMRPIFEALHWHVDWAPRSRTIMATHATGNYRLTMQLDNRRAVVNGAQYQLDVPPRLIFSTTYVPLRFVAEVTDCRVDYRGDEVKITGQDGTVLVIHLIGD